MNRILTENHFQLWNVCSLSEIPEATLEISDGRIFADYGKYTLTADIRQKNDGIFSRRDRLENTSDAPLTFTALRSRITFDGGEYEVYTQFNSWQNESMGQWHMLNTEISAHTDSVRSANGAAPFMALWSCQANRGMVFHLIADCSWNMTAQRCAAPGENSYVAMELGMWSNNMVYTVNAGESIDLPEILYYEFTDRRDFECYRLHRYCNINMPRRTLPVIYNTWLYRFDRIDFESTMKQIPAAAKLGAEYFVIDAGWFGNSAGWVTNIGDWTENLNSGFKGRMAEIADEVRRNGMKFGLWFEPERTMENTNSLNCHRDYFIKYKGTYFADFSRSEVRDFIFDAVSGVIDRFGVEYVKFDFNADLEFDTTGMAFVKYFEGYRQLIKRFRNEYPELYITNCASGGLRMTLSNCRDFDSFWFSDNQSPYHGMRIFKESMLRLPPQVIERWAVLGASSVGMDGYDEENPEHVFATGDAVCERLSDVSPSWLKGFLSAGTVGFSCDVAHFSPETQSMLCGMVADFKKQRAFWSNAECRILCDTKSFTVLQFNDRDFKNIKVQIFSNKLVQTGVTVYPCVDENKTYHIAGGERVIGAQLNKNGIYRKTEGNFKMMQIEISAE